jgi:indole-3-glycerol phosphate synthase
LAVNVLDKIVAAKRVEVDAARRAKPWEALAEEAAAARPPRDFVKTLAAGASSVGIGVIAEVKRASPSAGLIRREFDAVEIARIYERHGANCVSVLTDESFFQGHLDHLRAVRQAVSLPVLRKDFLLDRYQVLEARAAGADCVLLIAECLDDCRLRELYFYAAELGMDALIEIYEPENLERVLKLEPPVVGINNRNLKKMATDLEHSIRLRRQIPSAVLVVSESGIRTRDDVLRLQEAGIGAMLVGETLMRAKDIGAKLDELLGIRSTT